MQHIFTHQQQYPGEWSQGHHQQPHHHVGQHGQLQVQTQAQAQAQAQAAAAAAAAAQQQHYNRIAGNNGTALPGGNMLPPRGPANDIQANADIGMTEENKRVLDWIAQLMKPMTRESALLELSKKREQVPELALILWHSFGTVTPILHAKHSG
jgi:CCR4-NOT transcription complex subunit 9